MSLSLLMTLKTNNLNRIRADFLLGPSEDERALQLEEGSDEETKRGQGSVGATKGFKPDGRQQAGSALYASLNTRPLHTATPPLDVFPGTRD
jgi:hypothetical protein